MSHHRNAKLGLAGRYALVSAIAGGMTLKAAAAAFSVSPATAHRWWHRWREAGEEAQAALSCLLDRSSRPHRSPRQLAPELAEAICACRRKTGWGPRLVAGATGFAHSTVWKVLRRAGISRPAAAVKEPANRYEWPCPGDLLHMDTSEYVRFQRPGHRVTGDRSSQDRQHRDGTDIVHAIIDDHSRLAYAELLPSEGPGDCVAFLRRALSWYRERGITVERVLSDNGNGYRSHAWAAACAELGVARRYTRPRRPQTNGKAEALVKTLLREWAYRFAYPTSSHRARALPGYLRWYNQHRPHSSLGGRPPISRVSHVCGSHI